MQEGQLDSEVRMTDSLAKRSLCSLPGVSRRGAAELAADLMLPARPTVDAQVVAVASEDGISTEVEPETMHSIKVALPIVHMAGSDAHYNAHIESRPARVRPVPRARCRIPGSGCQRHVGTARCRRAWPQAALASRSATNADTDRIVEIQPQRPDPGIDHASRVRAGHHARG